MTRQTIYAFKTEINRDGISVVRVSKFTDGELESSYLTTHTECDCPAGVRPSCRHRQMLPQAAAAGIVNTHWFWDFDLGRAVDFSGALKSNFDAMNELAARNDEDPHSTMVSASDFDSEDAGSIPAVGASPASPIKSASRSWRRM